MKMFRISFVFLFLATLCVNLYGQEKSVEELWMDCVYAGYQDEGKKVKQIFDDFQKNLLAEGLLKDKSGTSYRVLLNEMAKGKVPKSKDRSSLMSRLLKIESMADNPAINACQDGLKQHPNYEKIIGSTGNIISTLVMNDDVNMQSYASQLLLLEDEFNFESTYTQLFIYIGLDIEQLVDPSSYQEEPAPVVNGLNESTPLEMTLIYNDRIQIGDKEISSEKEFKEVIYQFAKDHPYTAVYDLSYPRSTDAENVDKVRELAIEAIDKLRAERAQELEGKSMAALEEYQQEFIKDEFPFVMRLFPKSE